MNTSYGSTHIITAGDQALPPLLLLHGTGDHSAMTWIANVQALAGHFRIIAVDIPGGAGRTEPNDRFYKQFDSVQWLDEILDALHYESVHIAGVSYGVQLMLWYSVHRPERVRRFVGLSGGVPVKGFRSILQSLDSIKIFFPEMLHPTEANAMKLMQKLRGRYKGPEPAAYEALRDNWLLLVKHSKPCIRPILRLDLARFDLFRDKSLLLIGECDPTANHPFVIRTLQTGRLNFEMIPDAGHTLNTDYASLINRKMIDFLLR